MKKGPLNNVELHYINTSNLSPEQIAKDLGRSLTVVKKHLKSKEVIPDSVQPENLPANVNEPSTFERMIEQAKQGVEGVAIMTEAISSLASDSIKHGSKSILQTNRYKNTVAKVKPNR